MNCSSLRAKIRREGVYYTRLAAGAKDRRFSIVKPFAPNLI